MTAAGTGVRAEEDRAASLRLPASTPSGWVTPAPAMSTESARQRILSDRNSAERTKGPLDFITAEGVMYFFNLFELINL